jgi:hypothetical protein
MASTIDVIFSESMADILTNPVNICFGSMPAKLLMVKFHQPSHEFTVGVGMSFISYPLVLTPLV